jgi:hypothetical protein
VLNLIDTAKAPLENFGGPSTHLTLSLALGGSQGAIASLKHDDVDWARLASAHLPSKSRTITPFDLSTLIIKLLGH